MTIAVLSLDQMLAAYIMTREFHPSKVEEELLMYAMSLFRLAIIRLLFGVPIFLITVSQSIAAEVKFDCPNSESGRQIAMTYKADMLEITELNESTSLTASIQGDPTGVFTIVAEGPMNALMPDMSALEACLSTSLKEQNSLAQDVGALAYAEALCRNKLLPTGTLQTLQAYFNATSIDPGKSTLFIRRQYLVPSKVTGSPIKLDEFPTRNCDVKAMP